MLPRLWYVGLCIALCTGCGKPGGSSRATVDPAVESLLSDLTQAARRYGAEQRRVPKSMEELVAAGYWQSVPEAPAGKRFTIDPSLRVVLTAR